jgi:hypothetical protein
MHTCLYSGEASVSFILNNLYPSLVMYIRFSMFNTSLVLNKINIDPPGDSKVSYSWSTQFLSFIARGRCSVEDPEDLTTPEFVFDSAHNWLLWGVHAPTPVLRLRSYVTQYWTDDQYAKNTASNWTDCQYSVISLWIWCYSWIISIKCSTHGFYWMRILL